MNDFIPHKDAKPTPAAETKVEDLKNDIWNDKSLASFLRKTATPTYTSSSRMTSSEATSQHPNAQVAGTINYSAPGVRTMQEIEEEMRAQAQRARAAEAQQLAAQQQLAKEQQLLALQQQQQLAQQQAQAQAQIQIQQQQVKPPRMRSQSPFARIAQGARVDSPSIAYVQQQQQLLEQEQLQMDQLELQLRQQLYLGQADQRDIYIFKQARAQLEARHEQLLQQQQQLQQQHRQHSALPPRLDALHQRVSSVSSQASREELDHFIRQEQAARQLGRQSPMRHSASQPQLQMRMGLGNQRSPAMGMSASPAPTQADIAQVQMQQRLLAQMAQQEFSGMTGSLNGLPNVNAKDQEVIRAEAMKKIMEAEKLEGKRRRKAAKISHMVSLSDFPYDIRNYTLKRCFLLESL